MIGTDEPIALVVMKDGIVKTICYLGYANLESGEHARLDDLARAKGYHVYLTTVEEIDTFAQLYNEVQKAIT